MVAGEAAQLGEVVQIVSVIVVRAAMLDCFPRGQQAQAVEAPRVQAREVLVRFGDRKRTADEGDLAMVAKTRGKIGAAVGVGDLTIAAQIYAAQDDSPPMLVNEPSPFDMQS